MPTAMRWTARILSVGILLFWGFFFAAHLFGDQGRPSRPLNLADKVGLLAMAIWYLGLVLAWKWEWAGGTMAAVGALVGGAANPNALAFPGTLVIVAATLFLCSAWSCHPDRR